MNRNLTFIAIALFTWGMGEGLFFNFQPIYLAQLGSDPQQIGLILSAFGASMAITHIPAGHLADRIGRRPMLLAAWFMGLFAALVMGFAQSINFFVLGMLIYGLTAFVSAPLSSYTTAARGAWSISRVLTLTSATFNLGMVLGPGLGGWIGEHYGLRSVYFFAAGIFAISTLFIFFVSAQPIDHHDPASPPEGLFANTRLRSFLAIYAFAVFAMFLSTPLTPNFIEGVRGLSLSETGLIFTAGALGNALINIWLGQSEPRRGFIIAQLLVALFAILIWKGTGLGYFALGYFLLGGFRASRPLAMAEMRVLVHDSQMGLVYGIIETVGAIIFIVTPALAGFLYARDPYMIYPLALALIAASVTISLVLAPKPNPSLQ